MSDGVGPKLAQYSGRGELNSWLKVVSSRLMLNLMERRPKEESIDEPALLEVPEVGSNPELMAAWRSSENVFKAALSRATGVLTERERAILRLQYVEGRTLEEIATQYGVHAVSVGRWLAAARRSLALRLRTELTEAAGTTETADSLLRGLRSRLDLSLPRVLAGEGEESS